MLHFSKKLLCAYLMYNNVTDSLCFLCFLCLSMLHYGFNAFFFNGLSALLTLVVQCVHTEALIWFHWTD